MKNQYFGDVNDYRKYGLLRVLTGPGKLSGIVCWMLTPDDGCADGRLIEYLCNKDRWRRFDSELFDSLEELVLHRKTRRVCWAEDAGFLPCFRFYTAPLPDDRAGRWCYFESFWDLAKGCDLLFFDPDNGMEVKSKPCGRKNSFKYLYWDELECAYSTGCSVLIYQHFPHEKKDAFIARRAEEMRSRTGAQQVFSFRTPYVVFFLLLGERQAATLERNVVKVPKRWLDQIKVKRWQGA